MDDKIGYLVRTLTNSLLHLNHRFYIHKALTIIVVTEKVKTYRVARSQLTDVTRELLSAAIACGIGKEVDAMRTATTDARCISRVEPWIVQHHGTRVRTKYNTISCDFPCSA